MTRFAAERWDAREGAWVTLAVFGSYAEARCRLWELGVSHGRVREVAAVEAR